MANYGPKINLMRKIDVEKLRDLVENKKLQQWKIEKIMGIPHKKVSKFCKRYGIVSQRTGPRSGPQHTGWKGGRKLSKGYVYVWVENHPHMRTNHSVAEHRLVMEKKLGRYLDPKEVVHHMDHNPLNNHPDNLMVFGDNSEHLRHELTGKCPNWTDAGLAKLNKSGGRYSNPKKLKRGESRQPRPNDHQKE